MSGFKYLLYAFMLMKFDFVVCLNIKAHFPLSTDSVFPRIQITETLPNLEELTFCSWFKTYSLDNLKTLLSYSMPYNDNQLILGLKTRSNKTYIAFYMIMFDGVEVCSHINFQVGVWYHMCVNLFTPNGSVAFFVNGDLCEEFKNHSGFTNRGFSIPSGGVLLIGQEQDELNAKFETNQAWVGDIANLQIWSERLTRDQIVEAGKCKGKIKEGDVFAWMKTKISVFDNVTFSETQICNL